MTGQPNAMLILLVLLSGYAWGMTVLVPPDFDHIPQTHSYISQDTALRSRGRSGESPGGARESPEPWIPNRRLLQMGELEPEEMFKSMLIYDTQQAQATPLTLARTARPYQVGAAIAKSRWGRTFEYTPFTSKDYVVIFDRKRPGVRLPSDRQTLHEAVKTYAFDRWKAALSHNSKELLYGGGEELFPSNKGLFGFSSVDWQDENEARKGLLTTSQVTKDGLVAIVRTRQWAAQINAAQPGKMDPQAVERSLLRTWILWRQGLSDLANAYAKVKVEEIASKFHR